MLFFESSVFSAAINYRKMDFTGKARVKDTQLLFHSDFALQGNITSTFADGRAVYLGHASLRLRALHLCWACHFNDLVTCLDSYQRVDCM